MYVYIYTYMYTLTLRCAPKSCDTVGNHSSYKKVLEA